MIKGHTDIDIWNTGFFINADYFSDDFIIYNNTGKRSYPQDSCPSFLSQQFI